MAHEIGPLRPADADVLGPLHNRIWRDAYAGLLPPEVLAARDEDAPAPVELWSLYVAPEHQGSGVARELVQASLPGGPVYLWVLDGNHRAIAFYEKIGFRSDGSSKPFGHTGALEIRMARS